MAHIIDDLVLESSTSTGTGDITVAGAVTGNRPFSSVCSVGSTFFYAIRAVNAFGAPTGEWEIGLGTYSASNTITRTTVIASSNSNLLVNFSAGTKHAYITVPAQQVSWMREKLTSSRTYYVSTTGSDSADGKTTGTAFLTIQKAIDVATALDNNGYNVTISVGAGTFTGSNTFKSIYGGGKISIVGAGMASTIISTTAADCFGSAVQVSGTYALQDMKLTVASSGYCIRPGVHGVVEFQSIDFGTAPVAHLNVGLFSYCRAVGDFTISGSSAYHAIVGHGYYYVRKTSGSLVVTVSGTPNFSAHFAYASNGGIIQFPYANTSFSGSATGARYYAETNGIVSTQGGGASFLPGNSSGTTATGGQYN